MLILAFILASQDTIVVGHHALRAREPHVGVDTTDVFVERDGKRQLINSGIEKVSRTKDGYLVVYESRTPRGPMLDSITIAASTLAPIRHVEAFGNAGAVLSYGSGRLTGTQVDTTGAKKPVDVAVDPKRFDFSILTQITRMLPAEVGYNAVILTYDVSPMKEKAINYRVVGQEKVTWKGAEVNAMKTVTDFGTHQVSRWMDPKTRRDLKWEIKSPTMHMTGETR